MSSTALAHVMLRNGGLSVLLTWLGWLAVFLLLPVYVNVAGHAGEFSGALTGAYEKTGLGRLVLIGSTVALLFWTAMALGAAGAMSDRRWTPWIPRVAVIGFALSLVYLRARDMLAPAQYVTLSKSFCWVAGSWCSVTTLLAFYRLARNTSSRTER
jgi:hypothetical protein